MKNRGQNKNRTQGNCICNKCGYTIAHKQGSPCRDLICPKCGSQLYREGQSSGSVRSINSGINNKTSGILTNNNFPEVDPNLCLGCMACMSVCPAGAITNPDEQAFIVESACSKCLKCIEVCPADAIKIKK